jgi:hypothetical protein
MVLNVAQIDLTIQHTPLCLESEVCQ